jgi:hypothetical protein
LVAEKDMDSVDLGKIVRIAVKIEVKVCGR